MVGTSINSSIDGGDLYGPGLHAFRYVEASGVATIPYLAGGTWNGAMAVSPDGTLVVAEVRLRSRQDYGGGAASVDHRKQQRLLRAQGVHRALGGPEVDEASFADRKSVV